MLVSAALVASLLHRPHPLLVWNASPSSTVGLYVLSARAAPRVGDMVVAWPPPAARRLAAARGYLPASVPLVKRVAAVAGDRICARRDRIYINGRGAARRWSRDPSRRPLPHWSGCERLARGELFLLSPGTPDAFDGRYFGKTRGTELIGKARLLWG